MSKTVTIEVIDFKDAACGPFPCDENRTCGLEKCAPGEKLLEAFDALDKRMHEIYGDRVTLSLTLLDEGVPEYVKKIVEEHQPPLPIILVNGNVAPVGRISVSQIRTEVDKYLD